jgi:hypothetical protein
MKESALQSRMLVLVYCLHYNSTTLLQIDNGPWECREQRWQHRREGGSTLK